MFQFLKMLMEIYRGPRHVPPQKLPWYPSACKPDTEGKKFDFPNIAVM